MPDIAVSEIDLNNVAMPSPAEFSNLNPALDGGRVNPFVDILNTDFSHSRDLQEPAGVIYIPLVEVTLADMIAPKDAPRAPEFGEIASIRPAPDSSFYGHDISLPGRQYRILAGLS